MKVICSFILVVISLLAEAQNSQHEINEQVWKPFLKAFNENDTKAFMAVHSKDVVRSSRDDKQVLTHQKKILYQRKTTWQQL